MNNDEFFISSRGSSRIYRSNTYYREISTSLANAFVVEVENSINQILLYPQAWQPIKVGVRRCLVKRFPFGIYYTVESDNSATIQAVMHLSRKPGYWTERIKK